MKKDHCIFTIPDYSTYNCKKYIADIDKFEYMRDTIYDDVKYKLVLKNVTPCVPDCDICIPEIKKVIFNDPATIVYWADGTKTVVKNQKPDSKKKFDPEKGLAMAIAKKALGNTGRYFDTIKEWTEE